MEHSLVQPDLFKAQHRPFGVEVFQLASLTKKTVDAFLLSTSGDVLGLAPTYDSKCAIKTLAIYNGTKTFLIRFPTSKTRGKKNPSRPIESSTILTILLSHHRKFAFHMGNLTAALHIDFGLRIKCGIDLLSSDRKHERHSLDAIKSLLGDKLHHDAVTRIFSQGEKDAHSKTDDTALRAWASYQVAKSSQLITLAAKVDTVAMNTKHLDVIAKIIRDAARSVALKPTRQKNEIEKNITQNQGILEIRSTRFKTRLRSSMSSGQTIEIKTNGGQKVFGKATVRGRDASVIPQKHLRDTVCCVTTIGKEFTAMEKNKKSGGNYLESFERFEQYIQQSPLPVYFVGRTLNSSQKMAVSTILSNEDADRITLIHGPPGTGKTTVIAASITSIIAAPGRHTVWVIAQSNVAVKNVAEKLADVGFFDFKILVSEEFHYDWHEHLYEKLERNFIRSDEFSDDKVATERLLLNSRVILCTLSMLSNNRILHFARIVPLETIIVDEASQIEVGDYLVPLSRFKSSLRKLVFIGDHKQLAPYGHGDIPELCSIFEMPHLLKRAIFLDTQYRMPVPIGNFISDKVYDGKLKSDHTIDSWLSCSFIDIAAGKEEKSSHSWVNLKEVAIAIKVASTLHKLGKPFRIITPYDAQRSKLESSLKASDIPWEDKCFNVDSFQGNEADYIIVSVVRSEKIGFLNNVRRTNVMLTRCKRSMIVLANRKLVEGVAASTLIGELAKETRRAWITVDSVLNGRFHPHT
ncbi:hypothetical protein H0H92_005206 [Tricholoma furcatifolium]|nr:hypothetical protein H0H92_005206 [Tricholoma furcatifolium]